MTPLQYATILDYCTPTIILATSTESKPLTAFPPLYLIPPTPAVVQYGTV